MLALWNQALATDGGGPEPQAHRLVLDAVRGEEAREAGEHLRGLYVEGVAAVDLEADHHRFNRAVLGMDGCCVDQRGHAAPVGDRQHDLLAAHRPGVAEHGGEREAVERDLVPVGEAAGHHLEQVLGRVAGRAQGFDDEPRLAVERDRVAGLRIEHRDPDR